MIAHSSTPIAHVPDSPDRIARAGVTEARDASDAGLRAPGSGLAEQNTRLTRMLEQAGQDASDRQEEARFQLILTEEIHHRMKNMLAMVAAIVRQTMRSATDMREAQAAIETRLIAMGRAHDLLLQANLQSARLIAIVRGAIEQHDTAFGRISLHGADMEIQPASILPLTLALNELCTNATKYGALSIPDGEVALSWALDDARSSLIFRWVESRGPLVVPPKSKSLGSKLVEEVLPRQLGGRAQLSFCPSGFEYELAVPMARLAPAIKA